MKHLLVYPYVFLLFVSMKMFGTIYSYDENIAAKVGFISYCFGSKFWEMVIPLKRLRLFCSMALMKSVITISQSL